VLEYSVYNISILNTVEQNGRLDKMSIIHLLIKLILFILQEPEDLALGRSHIRPGHRQRESGAGSTGQSQDWQDNHCGGTQAEHYQVQAALDRARTGRTTIVVAHRLSTIRYRQHSINPGLTGQLTHRLSTIRYRQHMDGTWTRIITIVVAHRLSKIRYRQHWTEPGLAGQPLWWHTG
jgi:hypothetical protein